MRQHRSRARPIADSIACLLGGLTKHLGAKVLVGILEAELLGDGDPVVAIPFTTSWTPGTHQAMTPANRLEVSPGIVPFKMTIPS